MKKAKWVASASPNDARVFKRKKTFVYFRVTKSQLVDGVQEALKIMTQAAKVTLRTVKEIVNNKNKKNEP